MDDRPTGEATGEKRVPGARNGTVGVYDRPPAYKRWLPTVAGVIGALIVALVIYAIFF